MVHKGNCTPTRLEQVFPIITGATINFVFSFSRQLKARATIFPHEY